MNEAIAKLEPAIVWQYFSEILAIPRPSKKEEKIVAYLLDFGKKHQLETLQDEVGNVLIRKPANSDFPEKFYFQSRRKSNHKFLIS